MRRKRLKREMVEALMRQKEQRVAYWERYGVLPERSEHIASRREAILYS